MRLVANWRAVLCYAWTVRLALLAAVLNGLAITLSIITGSLPVAPLWLAVLNGVLAIAALYWAMYARHFFVGPKRKARADPGLPMSLNELVTHHSVNSVSDAREEAQRRESLLPDQQ